MSPASAPRGRVPGVRATEAPGPSGVQGGKTSTATQRARWAAVVVWIGVIFMASSDGFSASHTGNWLAAIVRAVFSDFPPGWFATMHATVRKGAHLVEYAILGWLIHRATFAGESAPARPWIVVLGLAAACALTDEAHQFLFTDSRTGSVVDVMIDVAGASLGARLAQRLTRLRQ